MVHRGFIRTVIVSVMAEEKGKQGEETKQSRWGFRGKTVWDFLQLLIVPLMLAAIGFWFTAQQDHRQQQIEDRRAQQAQKIENQRAEAERELAVQRAQDEALQDYLSQMGSLLLEKDLRKSEEGSEVRTLARARTLTVLGRLDPSRRTAAMQFLVEAELVQRVEGRGPIIPLTGANLSGADLPNADLSFANLSNASLFAAAGVSKEGLEQQSVTLDRTIMPYGTHTSTRAPTSGNLLFSDDFSHNSSGWPQVIAKDAGNYYDDGGYRIQSRALEKRAVGHLPSRRYQDVAVEVDAKVLNSQTGNIASGVVCRRQDSDNYYGICWSSGMVLSGLTK